MLHMEQCKRAMDDRAINKVLLDIEDFAYAGAKIVVKSCQEPTMWTASAK